MRFRPFVIVHVLAIVAAAFALLVVGLRQGRASQLRNRPAVAGRSQPPPAQRQDPLSVAGISSAAADDGGPIIQATQRISIPFFAPRLSLWQGGASALTFGGVICSAGEEVTIAITLTQSISGASASSEWNGTCTGVQQLWKELVTVASGPAFVAGEAEACGHATTRDDSGVTDTENWCDDVSLAWTVFLPTIRKE